MKEKKNNKPNETQNKSKKVKVIIPIILVLLIVLGIVTFAYTQNIQLAENNNEKREVEEMKDQAIILEDNKYMHVEEDASGDKVPVPNGFVGSKVEGENEIDTGYVIYSGEEEVNEGNVEEAQKTRNQYVWVPVPDISKFYGTDANGKKWGKIYEFTTGTSTDSTFDEETGTYANNWRETNGVMSISTGNYVYREPDVLPKYDRDYRLHTLGLGVETTHEFLMQMEKEFNKMVESVEKYGGFYIGRYETGDLNKEQAVVVKGNTDINYQTWYTMYKKCKELEESNTVRTGMIWGNQWDRTLMWLIETGNKTKEQIAKDSTSWGNYSNATFEYTNSSGSTVTKNEGSSTRIPSGSSEYTKANNIYDLAGNVYDWTMEANSSNSRDLRGGVCYNAGSGDPARGRGGNGPVYSGNHYGCRATLYIR